MSCAGAQKYRFSYAGLGNHGLYRFAGSVKIKGSSRSKIPGTRTHRNAIDGGMGGRVWIDPATYDVLRLIRD